MAISILVNSKHHSLWVLFHKLASIYFIWKICQYFIIGNGQSRELALCQLHRHTFVPCWVMSTVVFDEPAPPDKWQSSMLAHMPSLLASGSHEPTWQPTFVGRCQFVLGEWVNITWHCRPTRWPNSCEGIKWKRLFYCLLLVNFLRLWIFCSLFATQ